VGLQVPLHSSIRFPFASLSHTPLRSCSDYHADRFLEPSVIVRVSRAGLHKAALRPSCADILVPVRSRLQAAFHSLHVHLDLHGIVCFGTSLTHIFMFTHPAPLSLFSPVLANLRLSCNDVQVPGFEGTFDALHMHSKLHWHK
jgi:hypothetical protein